MRRLLLLLALPLLVACGAEHGVLSPGVDVDNANLRAIKADAGIADCAKATGNIASKDLPDVTLPCLGGGNDVDIAHLRGPLVINLWAQWCEPCRRELPIYQQFHEKYADKVALLGVDFQDTQPAAALRLARDAGVTYPSVADPDGRFRAPGLPRLIMVDAAGKVTYDEYIEIKGLAQLEGLVDAHLPDAGVA